MRAWWIRCTPLGKPGVGVLHVHRSWWRPKQVSSVWFEPEGTDRMHPVPEDRWESAFTADSREQLMALVRAGVSERPS